MSRKGQTKPKVKCLEANCQKFAVCKGFCGTCYARNRRKDPEYREILRLRQKKYNKGDYRREVLLRSYGLTEDSYKQMFDSQNGLCDICKKTPVGKSLHDVLHIDHCHETGQVRGLLCSPCNLAIGHLRYSVRIIDSGIRYLKDHKLYGKT